MSKLRYCLTEVMASDPANMNQTMSGAALLIFENAGPKSWVPKGKKSAPTRVPPFASRAVFNWSVLPRGQT